ncbi:universal stress protein [Falsiroseomonas sp. CW058]|uniref:universal stress protein n=1 Tax=Falsiroseomonas sp. CW058 TaxID=3388664 RepID=UPI003D32086F
MRMKDILVHLDGSPLAARRLDVAVALAGAQGAHLAALHAVEALLPPGLTADAGGAALGTLLERLREEADALAQRQRAAFEARVARDGIAAEWRQADFAAAETVALHARYADLTVLGQPEPGSGAEGAATAMLEAVLFGSGRPVLMVPYAGDHAGLGRRVMVAWNASKEAARAVADALPLLRAAAEVTVLAVNPRRGIGGHGDVPAADITLHLARHGVRATAEHVVAEDIREADALLNAVSDRGADLLVMGAYGHSRIREFMLGGVTRSILQRMTVPVLLAH